METKSTQQFLNSYSVKMFILAILAVLLLIPSFLIQELVQERMSLSEKVKNELYTQWGGKQVVAGPVLNIPYTLTEPVVKNQPVVERHGVAHFLPETIRITGTLYPETRKRGIYKVMVYEGNLRLKGSFVPPDVSRLGIQNAQFNWNAAYFSLGVSDMRGIKNLPELLINRKAYPVEPGVADTDLFASGITIKTGTMDPKQKMDFKIELVFNGSEDLSVEPLGKTSDVTISSDWAHPGFTGSFLPVHRQVTAKGFKADWRVTHLNRNFPQQWTDRKYDTHQAKFGVELLILVDHYQKSMRAVKYAILFIALNFIIFLFIELKSRIRIHPFQYVLIAFALLIFYALLTSIAEQTGFDLAYIISAMSVTAIISWYAFYILHDGKMVIWVTLLQTGLYLFLFTILQLHDYALLTGSIGLFLILAIIMRASYHIKWYRE